tara:strand:- start:2051 stop:4141 length:2091 start_codon:yes stop_codon:yes gene_type:complete
MSDAKQVDKFKSALHNNGYLCTDTFSNEVYCALKKKPMSITMLIGQAGTGKSFLPETLGKVLGCNVYVKQAYQGMDWDEFVRKHIPDENAKSGIKSIDAEILRAVKESKDKRVILLLDEWDKTRVSSDSYFLDFLQTGRISVSGKVYQANQDNLIIFFTSNDERDVSEPLLRRVKVLEVKHLPTSLIANVLKSNYKNNNVALSIIEPVLKLYETAINSNMDKPATLQELCDLINDYVTYKSQSIDPNWEDLIRVNITKNDRNHTILIDHIDKETKENSVKKPKVNDVKLDVSYFDKGVSIKNSKESKNSLMPMMKRLRNFDESLTFSDKDIDDDIFVQIRRDDDSYTDAFIEASDNNVDIDVPYFIGWHQIKENTIQRSKPYQLSEIINSYDKFKRLRNSDGVIVFIDYFIDKDDVINLIEISNGVVKKATDKEIIFRMENINGRWQHLKGVELIVPTSEYQYLYDNVQGCHFYSKDYVQVHRIHDEIKQGNLKNRRMVSLRSLGGTKNYIDVNLNGMGCKNDSCRQHIDLVNAGGKVKETARTTFYDFGWATIRSWHKNRKPNYKHTIVIKSSPSCADPSKESTNLLSKQIDMLRYLFNCNNGVNIPLFVNLPKEQFDKFDDKKWKRSLASTRIKQKINKPNDPISLTGYNTYAINTYDRTTVMICDTGYQDKITNVFMYADQLRAIRNATMEVV